MKVYLSSKGIRPDIDNSPVINRVLETAKEGSTIVFKDGKFPITSTLIQSKKIHWEGTEDTTLIAAVPITLARFTGGHKARISNINFKGSYSIYDKTEWALPGIQVSAVVIMSDILIRNVWGNGLEVSADLSTGAGNASASRFDNLDIIECKGHGMYFQGGDGNQCGVYHADVRDCNGIGICDDSFLGNQFYSCMTHNNKGGSYRAGDINNFAGFYGCYAEGAQPPVYLDGHAVWFGGLPYDGINAGSRNVKVYSFGDVSVKYL